jgi:RNA polymerase sigma-70 factor (ECF subfamily)
MSGPETFVGQRRTALFEEQRPQLLGLTYRLLGSVSEAEAMLDETRERWSAGHGPEDQDPETALTTLVVTLALDRMRRLRAARQGYARFWLPEPVPCRALDDGPLSMELLAAMERLSPLERAAFVLRVVLARPYSEVATVLGRRPAAVRQLVRRARVHLGDQVSAVGTPDDADRVRHEVVVRRLAAACRSASLGALVGVLDPDVVLLSDEGARGPLRAQPVVGRDRVARSVVAALRRLPRGSRADVETVNGTAGVVLRAGQHAVCVLAVRLGAERVVSVQLVADQRKLTALHATVAPTATATRTAAPPMPRARPVP